jgi:hypothetical protein
MTVKLKIEKRGNEVLKKCSPLKLLSQSQPHFAEMIFGWFSSKFVSGISDLKVGITGHNFGMGPCKDHSIKVWLELT